MNDQRLQPDSIAQTHYLRGTQLFEQRNLTQAMACFELVIEADPTAPEGYNGKGAVLQAEGNAHAALAQFDEAIRRSPTFWKAFVNRAQALLAIGAAERASADLDLAIANAPREAWAVRGIARCCFDLLRYQEAIDELTAFIDRGNGDAWASTMRGLCYAKMNEADYAMRDFSVALELDPNSSWTYSCRGIAHLDQGKPEAAVVDFTQLIQIEPRFESAYRNRAIAYARMKNFSAAISDLDKDIELNPRKTAAYQARAECWRELKEYANEIEDYSVCVELEPTNAEVLRRRGVAFYHMKDYEAAVADLCSALVIEPNTAGALNWRGYCQLRLHDLESGIADFTAAIQADPNFSNAYLNRARAWVSCGENEKALEDLNLAVEHDPSGCDALLLRAKRHMAKDDVSSAIADLSEAIRRQPNDARLFRLRAKIYSETGDIEKCEADCASLTTISDENSNQEKSTMNRRSKRLFDLIKTHFSPVAIDDITISERRFPNRVRADIQVAIDRLLTDNVTLHHFSGVRKQRAYEGVNFSELIVFDEHDPALSVPPQYEEIDIGGDETVRCLKDGIWLLERDEQRFVLFLEPGSRHGRMTGIRFQIATANDHAGTALSQLFFKKLEEAVFESKCYRGKILSLEYHADYSGVSSGIRVHQLKTVERDDVVLPSMTLALLERNVIQFVSQRSRLRELGMSTKKGLLFYGPPGTGKTHTIHFLAKALTGHTMLLISAEQVALLDEYMSLARLLQPSIVVIEDVDLITRDRENMDSPCEEVLLNKLLNEMDGLKEDADILFILTTNRPGALEAALASRPGRVDQAIEFPLPDEEGLRKLVKLYSPKLVLDEDLIQEIIKRAAGVSAAFIKELMRRTVQFSLEGGNSGEISKQHVHNALDEMLFKGGMLNLKLLGGKADVE